MPHIRVIEMAHTTYQRWRRPHGKQTGRGVVLFEDDPWPIGPLDKLVHKMKDRGWIPLFKGKEARGG